VNGFLIIDKQAGISSYDVIRKLKRIRPFKKIGYIGTLDRNATGVLPVALNEAVKLISFLEDVQKTYKATVLLGTTTDTLDIEGKVLSTIETEPFETAKLEDLLQKFEGKITQQIPAYSSKKVKKKPLYKWAREGIPMEPSYKEVEVFQIRLLEYKHPYLTIEVSCSKGTYIRAIAQDFGASLGCGATLYSLKRTKHGEFTESMYVNLDNINVEEDLLNSLISLENVLKYMKGTTVESPLEKFLRQGMPVPLAGNPREWLNGELTRLFNKKGTLIGIGTADTLSKTIKIKRLINS
jgi:tRNA pseudouridine55 synthase